EESEEGRADACAIQSLGGSGTGERYIRPLVTARAGKRPLRLAVEPAHAIGNRRAAAGEIRRQIRQEVEAVRLVERQRPQQNIGDDGEDGARGAHTERNGDDGDRREGRCAPECPEGESNILSYLFEQAQ